MNCEFDITLLIKKNYEIMTLFAIKFVFKI